MFFLLFNYIFWYFSKVNVDYLCNKNEARMFPQIILGVKWNCLVKFNKHKIGLIINWKLSRIKGRTSCWKTAGPGPGEWTRLDVSASPLEKKEAAESSPRTACPALQSFLPTRSSPPSQWFSSCLAFYSSCIFFLEENSLYNNLNYRSPKDSSKTHTSSPQSLSTCRTISTGHACFHLKPQYVYNDINPLPPP